MKVKAAPGLRVPRENNPHTYIDDQTAVEVDEASAYYARALFDGDLVEVPAGEDEKLAAEDKPSKKKA